MDESIQQADSPKSMNNLSVSNPQANKKHQFDFTNESILQSNDIYNSKPLIQMTTEDNKVLLLKQYMNKMRDDDKRHDRNHDINQMNLKLAQFQVKNEKIEQNQKL